jgi:hypothetical protein
MWDEFELQVRDLDTAARYGNLEMVQYFVAGGVPVNGRGLGTYTPLLLAAFCGKIHVMEWLLANGASLLDTEVVNGVAGMNALLLSIVGGHLSAAEYLCCKWGASPATSRTSVGGTVWTELQPHCLPTSVQVCEPNEVEPTWRVVATAPNPEVVSLLKVLVMYEDPPSLLLAQYVPHYAELCARGSIMRTQLPSYLEQQRAVLAAHCPMVAVVQDIVRGYAVTTTEDMWAYGLRVQASEEPPIQNAEVIQGDVRPVWKVNFNNDS